MSKKFTKEQIIDMFCSDMGSWKIQAALSTSFAKYNRMQHELAKEYEALTKIPADEFMSAYASKKLLPALQPMANIFK